jgi:hypothetical protein
MQQDNIPRVAQFLNSIAAEFDAIDLYRSNKKRDQPVLRPIGITSMNIRMGMAHVANADKRIAPECRDPSRSAEDSDARSS